MKVRELREALEALEQAGAADLPVVASGSNEGDYTVETVDVSGDWSVVYLS